jgi:Na+/pantothenate symporter
MLSEVMNINKIKILNLATDYQGGIKAVVWTDAVQTFSMFGAMFLVIIKGTLDVGGFQVVINRNLDTQRIEGPE